MGVSGGKALDNACFIVEVNETKILSSNFLKPISTKKFGFLPSLDTVLNHSLA